jgi:hypothetical protein
MRVEANDGLEMERWGSVVVDGDVAESWSETGAS